MKKGRNEEEVVDEEDKKKEERYEEKKKGRGLEFARGRYIIPLLVESNFYQ